MAAVNVNNGFGNGSKEEQGFSDAGENVPLKATRSVTTMATHIMVGIVVGVNLLFATRFGMPSTPVNQHIVLCVIGFTLMMGESILALAPDSWLSTLKLKHKRLIHWVMQVVGSLLAIIGCVIMSLSKTINWNTLHGQFALVAMVFTTVSLVNGLASLYAYEWRRVIPGILSKLTHICFGIVAFGAANISLAYGIDKNSFRNFVTTRFADALIIMTGALTVIIIINPFITFFNKFKAAVTK